MMKTFDDKVIRTVSSHFFHGTKKNSLYVTLSGKQARTRKIFEIIEEEKHTFCSESKTNKTNLSFVCSFNSCVFYRETKNRDLS